MNEEKKVPFKWEYGEETISLQLGMYANNQRLYIGMITHTEDGAEAFADMTVNLPGYSLDPGEEMRLFLTEDGYQAALQSQQRREIKIKRYARVIEGHILDFKPGKRRRS